MFDKLNELFKLLEKEFPYSSMGPIFSGVHHICVDRDGKLTLNVWANGRLWRTQICNSDDFNNLQDLVDTVRSMVYDWQ